MKINNEAKMMEEYIAKLQDIINNLVSNNTELNLRDLKEIKVVNNFENKSSDGRFEIDTILLPRDNIENYIKNEEYNTIKSTIYHEFCHVDLKSRLPQLHNLSEKYKNDENYIKYFTIMVYIEYIAHIMSLKYETEENIKRFLNFINNRKWDFNDKVSRMYFIKYVPYVLGRINNNFEYIDIIKNYEFKIRVVEVKEIIERIPNVNLIDDYNILIELEKYVSKYISND